MLSFCILVNKWQRNPYKTKKVNSKSYHHQPIIGLQKTTPDTVVHMIKYPFVMNKLLVVVVTHEFHSISISREAGTWRIRPRRSLAWLPRSPPSSQPVRPAPHLVNISLHFLYQMITRLMACDVTLRSAAAIK